MVRQGKVLLADTHQNMLAGVRSLLENMFEKVFMVSDEASLLEAAGKLVPDLILVDLSFPISLEINIVRRLNKTCPHIKLIVLSIYDEQIAVEECIKAGAAGFVLKRTVVNDLIPAVEAVLGGKRYISPSVAMKPISNVSKV